MVIGDWWRLPLGTVAGWGGRDGGRASNIPRNLFLLEGSLAACNLAIPEIANPMVEN